MCEFCNGVYGRLRKLLIGVILYPEARKITCNDCNYHDDDDHYGSDVNPFLLC